VFSRRAIQGKLDRLEEVLSPEQHAKLVTRLNRPGRERLAAMWEVVFLQALSQVAAIRHEVALQNGRQPDFAFEFDHGGGCLTIVGDIASVSDVGLDKQNLFREFCDEGSRLARKYRLDSNHFRYDVAGEQVGEWPKSKMKLLLPTGEAFTQLIKGVVEPFFRDLRQSPAAAAELKYEEPGVRFSIRYDESQWASGGGHPCYDLAMSLTENPIYRALRAKADQLRAAPKDAIRIIILCDGDCAAMRKSILSSNYSARQIATEFLRKTSAVDLVLLATVEQRNPHDLRLRDYVMSYDLTAAPQQQRSTRVSNDIIEAVRLLLERSVREIPTPMADACNAALRCEEGGYGLGKHGWYEMDGNVVRISARLVQELLAGDVSAERFAEFHRWDQEPGGMPNPFARSLRRGELISAINVIDCGDEDDDQLEFCFGPPNPAVSPFRRTNHGGSAGARTGEVD